jgi:hypothetical protein
MRRSFVLLALLFAAVSAKPAFAQATDVIRGKVTGPDTMPLSGVNVKVTSYLGQVTKTAKTNKNGQFTVIFPIGEGDYWVEFTAIGFVPKRFEIKRIAEEEILLADTKMATNAATLDQVNVIANANRALPTRTGSTNDVSGAEKPLTNAGLPPDLAGNLAAMASQIPGIQLIPGMDGAADMFSALGLGPEQNNTTLNGLGSAIDALPRDAQISASIRPISYDPAIGGFSGANVSLGTIPGNNFSRRKMTGQAQEPNAEWTTDPAEEQGAKQTYLSIGGSAGGPITFDKHFYNLSYQYNRKFRDLQSLLNTNAIGLNAAGVSRDSADRLLDILQNKNIPATVSRAPRQVSSDEIRLFSNFDLTPHSFGTGNSFNLTAAGNYFRQGNAGSANIFTTPGHNVESERKSGNLSLNHTNYFWFGVLSRTAVGTGVFSTSSEPYLRLPNGSVRINSQLSDGSSAIKSLTFGGSPAGNQDSRNRSFDFLNTMTWYSGNNRHVLKLATAFRNEWYTIESASNTLGSFSFNSLADLEAGIPSSFSRTLFSPKREGSQTGGSIALGDSWIPKTGVQIQYGLRVDGNHFGKTPEFNSEIDSVFGYTNTSVPNHVYVSPRAGFQWIYGKAPVIAFTQGAARPPRALVRGGIGVFQNMGGAGLVEPVVTFTGLPSSTQQISCVGVAAPTPDWSNYLTNPTGIPTACADGTAGTIFSNASPSASVFDPAYRQQRVLRTSLDWSGPIISNRFAFGVSASYSRNGNQTGSVDINFDSTTRFALDNESGRPIFAPVSAIVPTTGSIASSSTRVSNDFSRVSLLKSDLRSSTKQVYFSLRPVINSSHYNWNLSYTLQDVQERYRGFSSTVRNPFDVYSGTALTQGRHTINATVYYNAWDLIRFYFNFGVGTTPRFTPMVEGDINGDGSRNDRAFIFDPTRTSDPAVAAGIQSFLDKGAPSVRKCLTSQLNQLAARGSCAGRWTPNGNISIQFNQQKIGLPQRFSIKLSLNNPLLLADMIAHGDNNMHGWGQNIQPDPYLLFVRGFDPVTQRYKYEVNQRFGSTRPAQNTSSGLTYVTLELGFNIGVPQEKQMLTQRLDIGRKRPGTKYPAATLKSMGSGTIPNPMAMILQQPDTLKLTRKQADSLAAMSRAYTLYAEGLWVPVGKTLEALPVDYDHSAAYDPYVEAREKTIDYLMNIVPAVKKLLTPAQKRMLPQIIMNYLDVRVLRAIRTSSALG